MIVVDGAEGCQNLAGGTTIVCCTGAVKKVDCENQGREKICLSSGRRSSCRRSWIGSFSGPIRTSTVSLCRRAVARNMPWLATPIADLACRVQGTTVGCSAISRDMTLVSSVTKHQLCKTHDPRACHMHSISLPELDSRVHSGSVHHICNRLQGVGPAKPTTETSTSISASGGEACASACSEPRAGLTWTIALFVC